MTNTVHCSVDFYTRFSVSGEIMTEIEGEDAVEGNKETEEEKKEDQENEDNENEEEDIKDSKEECDDVSNDKKVS